MNAPLYYLKEIGFGLVWGLIITLLIVAPGVVSDSVDFIYANF
jgi:hypothetical protein